MMSLIHWFQPEGVKLLNCMGSWEQVNKISAMVRIQKYSKIFEGRCLISSEMQLLWWLQCLKLDVLLENNNKKYTLGVHSIEKSWSASSKKT